jgi:hypothetical protein
VGSTCFLESVAEDFPVSFLRLAPEEDEVVFPFRFLPWGLSSGKGLFTVMTAERGSGTISPLGLLQGNLATSPALSTAILFSYAAISTAAASKSASFCFRSRHRSSLASFSA